MRTYTTEDYDLIVARCVQQARGSFWAYRQLINPTMLKGWWQREISYHLQDYYVRLINGERPMMVIEAPPQHGKSVQITEFISWVAGHNPDLKTIYTSFSERLGVRANLRLQRIYDSEKYKMIFPATRINSSNIVTMSGQRLRNREIMEYVGYEGYFRNTTVGGQITGESLDLGIVDDPIKGREEAGSETIRDKTFEWLTDNFMTRFSEHAGFLAILTRWHIDDPIGRLIKQMPEIKVLKYPAIATVDEPNRNAGDALFPEHKSLEFLMRMKGSLSNTSWESLYQQNPIIPGGEIIKGADFIRYEILPVIKFRNIYGDTAMKIKEHNDYSVFECWGLGDDMKLYLIDMVRGKWEAPELRRRAIEFWNKHNDPALYPRKIFGALRKLGIEDKASGTGLIQDLRINSHIPVEPIERHIDKYTRVCDATPYIEAHRVCLPAREPFTHDFIAECEAFTADDSHQFDDQIDPMCDAIEKMLATKAVGFFSRR